MSAPGGRPFSATPIQKLFTPCRRRRSMGPASAFPIRSKSKWRDWSVRAVPGLEKVRMCNSGTEACMSAIRLARGFTGRDKIIKFDGCYHGHADSLLVKAGSGALTFGHPDSAGVPAAFTQHTIVLPFNDPEAVRAAFAANPRTNRRHHCRAGPGQRRVVFAQAGLSGISARNHVGATAHLLIFDEVMTGFRLALGRRAGAVRHSAGLELLRKNHRRRLAGRRVWRPGRNHGFAGAAGAGLSGGHAERQSAGHGGGHRRHQGTCLDERLREAWKNRARPWKPG